MEYKQIYQRLGEEPLVVLEQVLHDVSEIYQSRVQQNIQECVEQKNSKVMNLKVVMTMNALPQLTAVLLVSQLARTLFRLG